MHTRGNGRDGRWALWRIPNSAANSTIPIVDLTAVVCFHHFLFSPTSLPARRSASKEIAVHGQDQRLLFEDPASSTPFFWDRVSCIIPFCNRDCFAFSIEHLSTV